MMMMNVSNYLLGVWLGWKWKKNKKFRQSLKLTEPSGFGQNFDFWGKIITLFYKYVDMILLQVKNGSKVLIYRSSELKICQIVPTTRVFWIYHFALDGPIFVLVKTMKNLSIQSYLHGFFRFLHVLLMDALYYRVAVCLLMNTYWLNKNKQNEKTSPNIVKQSNYSISISKYTQETKEHLFNFSVTLTFCSFLFAADAKEAGNEKW